MFLFKKLQIDKFSTLLENHQISFSLDKRNSIYAFNIKALVKSVENQSILA